MSRMSVTVRQRLEELAADVESSSQSAADRLRDLGEAVDGGQYADTWAAADIFQIIDPDTIAEQVRGHGISGGFVRFIEVLRNVLVFTPIAVTWIGIWFALENYGTAVRVDPALAEQSFLYLWQEGLLGPRLSTIALIDGVLLVLVAFLTLVVLSRNNQRDRYADQIRDELAGVLAEASLVLTGRRTHRDASLVYQFDQAAQALLAELHQERLRIQELANRKEKEVGDLSAFARDFMAGAQSVLVAGQTLHQVPAQIEKMLASLGTEFQSIVSQQKGQQRELNTAMEKVTMQLKLLTDTYRVTSMDLQGMGTNLNAIGTSLQTMGTGLRDGIQTSQNAALQTVQAVADMRAATGNLAAAQTQFLAALAHERGTIEKGIQGMHMALQSLHQVHQGLERDLANLSRILQQMAGQRQGAASRDNQSTARTQEIPEVR